MGASEEIVANNKVMAEEMSKRAALGKPVKRFVQEVVLGMTESENVRLSEIGGAWGGENLETVENRLRYYPNSKQ